VTAVDIGGVSRGQSAVAVLVGLALAAAGAALSSWVMTDGGDITIEETTIETESGHDLSATVYEPADASRDEPAPVVTLIHGYTGERGTMSSFARELADRGYVAITVDQPGHGESDTPAFADGWGGPATLEYARSHPKTDEDRVAMIGHSMGGFASLAAAEEHPDGYDSIILVGSTWGDDGDYEDVPQANETFPRNLALLYAPYDEFSATMYDEPVPGNVGETEKVKQVFGADETVERGEIYGSVADGTARRYTAPPTVHTGMHRSTAAVSDALEWVTLTIGDADTDTDSQSWYWGTLGHVVTLVGLLLVAIGATGLAWRVIGRNNTRTETQTRLSASPRVLAAASALPALTIVSLYAIGVFAVPTTRLTHQQLTHGYALWVLGTVGIAAGIQQHRRGNLRMTVADLGHDRALAAGAGVAGVAVVYALLWALGFLPGTGARAWLVGIAPIPPVRLFSALVYGSVFLLGGIALSVALDRLVGRSPVAQTNLWDGLGRGLAAVSVGLLVLLALFYLPLFAGYGLPVPALGPLTTQIMRSTFLIVIATILATGVTNATRRPLIGGVLAGLFVTWIVVATGPIHVAPF